VGPGERPVLEVEAVDAIVVVAGVDAAEGDRRGRVELARGAEPLPERAALPSQRAGLRVDGVHVAAVVADVEGPAVIGGGRLDRPAQGRRPALVAVAGAEREQLPVFAAEVEGVAHHQGRGLGAPGQLVLPEDLAGLRVQLHHVPRVEVDDVEAVLVIGGGGGVEAADAAFPQHLARVRVQREGGAAVVDRVERAVGVDRRELEQRPLRVVPEQAEGRLDPLRRQVAGAGRVEAEHRPVDGLRLRLRGLLGLESDAGVVDVRRPLQQLIADGDAGQQHHRPHGEGDRQPPMVAPEELLRFAPQPLEVAPPGRLFRAFFAGRRGGLRGHRGSRSW
jgi:hypothetical protein